MTLQTVDRYTIKAQLGSGGMATVYQAYDPRFEREVAIKVLPREFLHDKTFLARFEREAKVIAALEHAAIVPVYDFGEHEGQPYLVMRYMRGGSLAARLKADTPPLDEIATILERIGAALDKAHARGIIHRDVKPGNILFDEDGAAYLTDFGIVKVTEATAQLTGSGIVGTPAYMAPEMAEAGDLTPLIDIYALGVTLFEMLAGRQPYEAKTPMGVLMAHVSKPVPDVHALRPDLPDGMQAVVERGMAKNPADRYPSAGEMAADLWTALRAEARPEPAPPTPRPIQAPASPEALTVDATDPAATAIPMGVTLPETGAEEYATPVATEVAPPTPPPERPAARRAWAIKRRTLNRLLCIVVVLGFIGIGIIFLTSRQDGRAEMTPGPAEPTEPANQRISRNADWTPHIEVINGVEMARVPAGCFQMGSNNGRDDEQPVHEVCFDQPFWIDVYEVNNRQYGGAAAGCLQHSSEPTQPRVCLNWYEAKAHCESRGAHLPTEAEWEYAARGPDGLMYPWGNTFDGSLLSFCDTNCGLNWADKTVDDGYKDAAPVGSHPGGVSWVGAYDLSGNVWEWVNDWYGNYSSGRQVNPTGPSSGDTRVLRGGSWGSDDYDVRAAFRHWYSPDDSNRDIGFRCVRSYQP